jgi:hypothetical protein
MVDEALWLSPNGSGLKPVVQVWSNFKKHLAGSERRDKAVEP